MRIFCALGFIAGTAALTIAGRPTQNDRLRAENRSLQFEVIRLSRIADQLAATLYEKAVADDVAAHPSNSLAADLADLDAVETFQDFLYLTGGES